MDAIETVNLAQEDGTPTMTFFTPPVISDRDQSLNMILIEKEITDMDNKNVK